MIYFAHRGASALAVQNTTEAFALAHAYGARKFELDVHLLKDGAVAVHHDYSLSATAGADIQLADLTADGLKNHPLKNPFSERPAYIPLLQDILPVVSPELEILNIELKNDDNRYPGLEKAVLDVLPKPLLNHVLFSSFAYDSLLRLRALAPQARIGLLTRRFDVQQALNLKAESIHINQTRFTPQLAQQCHAHGLRIFLYTVNDIPRAQALAAQGADGIFTDYIHLFM